MRLRVKLATGKNGAKRERENLPDLIPANIFKTTVHRLKNSRNRNSRNPQRKVATCFLGETKKHFFLMKEIDIFDMCIYCQYACGRTEDVRVYFHLLYL